MKNSLTKGGKTKHTRSGAGAGAGLISSLDTELSRIAVTAASAGWVLSVLGLAEAETLRLYNDGDEGFLRREGLEYKAESFVWFKKQDNEETSGLKS